MTSKATIANYLRILAVLFPFFLSAQCPTPTATVTQPTCTTSVGSIVVTSPLNSGPSTQYEYSLNGTNYNSGIAFLNVSPGTYNLTVRNIISGCVSSPFVVTINPAPVPPTAPPFLFCDIPDPDPLIVGPHVTIDFNNVGQTSFTVSYVINGVTYLPPSFTAPSHFTAVPGVVPGVPVTLTVTWNGICAPPLTVTCYPVCNTTSVTPVFTQMPPICQGQPVTPLPTTSNNGIVGTWTPGLNNTATTTYTFTPNAGYCATPTQMTVTVVPTATPAFNPIAPICSGQTLAPLPTTSNNGITGTWSPALDNTQTTTYTFTPAAGQCTSSTLTTMTITVNPIVTPIFNAVASICAGATLAPLPTTSTNGITGVWSPALDNTQTTTYTFTPTAGQCTPAVLTTLTINVIPIVTPTFNTVGPICAGDALAPLPTTSTNGVTGSWSPALNNTATTTYTFVPSGQCVSSVSLTITVIPRANPTFTQVAPICEGTPLSPLPTTSNNGILGTWNPAIDNTVTTIYTFTPNAGICANTATMQIVVTQQTTPVVNVQAQCNASLVSVTSPLGNDFQYAVDGQPYQSSPNFTGLAVGNHTLVANQVSTNCLSTQVSFTVNPTVNDVVVVTPQPLQYCDPNNDGFGIFNLTQVIPFVTGGVPYTVTFHETYTDAFLDGTAIVTPSNYGSIGLTIQTIYIRVESITTTCFEIVPLQLNVNPTPEVTEPEPYHECDNDYDGSTLFNLGSITPEVLGFLDPSTHTVTYHTSLLDAQNDTGAITATGNYLSTSTTLWIRVEIIATGCYRIVELQLVVDPLPLSTQPAYPAYSLCDSTAPTGFELFDLSSQVSTILMGQVGMNVIFYPTLADAQANTSGIINTTAYQNIPPFVQTLGIRVTNIATGCYVISTMDIRVEPMPTLVAPVTSYTVCDPDQNGFDVFDLCTLTASLDPSGNYTVTYHYTQSDAQAGTGDLPCIYNNNVPFMQLVWVRAEDAATGCVTVMSVMLQVDPSPVMPATVPDLVVCDQDANNQDGITPVNLELQTPGLLSAQTTAASDYTVSYYTSLAGANAGLGSNIVTTTAYVGTDAQVIWIRIENNATGCFSIGSFILQINTPLPLTNPTPLSVCDNDANPNNLFTTFNLTVKDNEITAGGAYQSITYYPSFAQAQAGTSPITTPTAYINTSPAVQTLGVMVMTAEGCKSYTTLDIRVLPIPTPATTPPALAAQCENALDSGQQTFDLTQNAAFIANGDPNVTLHYFHSLSDATSVPPQNEIIPATAALIGNPALLAGPVRPVGLVQNIYVVVSSNTFTDFNGQDCYAIVEQPFTINPLPIAVAIGAQQICEADPTGTNDGFEVFDLTSYIPAITAGNSTSPVSSYNVTFYTDAALTNQIPNPSSYTNVTNPQIIYTQVTNTTTGCSSSSSFDILVNPKPELTSPGVIATCDDEFQDNDGYYLYPLDGLVTDILGTNQSATDYTVSFYTNFADADAGTNAITNTATYQAQTQTLWIRVENNTTGCYQTGSFDFIIEQYATPIVQTTNDMHTICVDYTDNVVVRDLTLFATNTTVYLNTQVVPQPEYTYQWYADGVLIADATAPGYTIDQPFTNPDATVVYTVVMTSTSTLGCPSTSQSFPVTQSGAAEPLAGTVGYSVTAAFTDSQTITVTVQGWGTYQYSLDDGPRQDSPVFENVPLGSHLITVWDTEDGLNNSCDALYIQQIQTIGYPHYFTPNGDGIHDTWNIVGLEDQPNTKIYIFDRFGKLLKQISSSGEGWDGTYNGQPLPSTDYWFTVDFNEQNTERQFKAHFTLKR